jgi:hypothetical protein
MGMRPTALNHFINNEMTRDDWTFLLSENFSDDVLADIAGCDVDMIKAKRSMIEGAE